MSDTFTCCHCNKTKDNYFMFRAAHGRLLCLWCAEDYGLVKPRRNTRARMGGGGALSSKRALAG